MSSQAFISNATATTLAAVGDGYSVPRMPTAQRLAIVFTARDQGMMVYDTTLNNLFIWNGSAWESVPASGDAGANGSVQYNDNGVVSGAANLQYDKAGGFTSLRSGSTLRAYVADNSVYSTISDLGAAGGLTINNLNADGISLKIASTDVLNVYAGTAQVTGSATITGDLTVDTSTLKVDSANDNVIVGATSAIGGGRFSVQADLSAKQGICVKNSAASYSATNNFIRFTNSTDATVGGITHPAVTSLGVWGVSDIQFLLSGAGSTAMTLNSTGLGVGVASPSEKLTVWGASTVYGDSRFNVGLFDPTSATTGTGSGVSMGGYTNGTTIGATFAQIKGIKENSTAGNIAGAFVVSTLPNGGTPTERLRIDSSGNVGIGGVTPSAWYSDYKVFQVKGSSLSNNGGLADLWLSSNIFVNSSLQNTYIATAAATRYRQTAGTHVWDTAPSGTAGNAITFTQAMTIDASGNLLVGRTSVAGAERLCVEKDQATNEIARFRATNATDPYGLAIQYTANISTAGNDFAAYYVNATTIRFGFRSNGGMANYQANNVNLSDSRTKTDIKPLASYWNKIKALELVTFKYNDQSHSDDNIGLIAQQVESVAPEFVDVDGFGKTPEDGVPLKTIYTTDLYHASIKALQEAMARIEVLEAKLA
jgi:hypothetical protein